MDYNEIYKVRIRVIIGHYWPGCYHGVADTRCSVVVHKSVAGGQMSKMISPMLNKLDKGT